MVSLSVCLSVCVCHSNIVVSPSVHVCIMSSDVCDWVNEVLYSLCLIVQVEEM